MVNNAQAQQGLLPILGRPSGDQAQLTPTGDAGFAAVFAQLMGSFDPNGAVPGAALPTDGHASVLAVLQQTSRFDLEALLQGRATAQHLDPFASLLMPNGAAGPGPTATPSGEQLLHLLQVPPGQYAISSSEVVDGDWIVEATPRSGDMPSIRIAIPTELLRNGLDLSQLNLGNGKNDPLAQLRGEFSQLLKDVRATELEVRLTPAPTETAEESFNFRLTGHLPEGEVAFGGTVRMHPSLRGGGQTIDPQTGLPVKGDAEAEQVTLKNEMKQSGDGMTDDGQPHLAKEAAATLTRSVSPESAAKKFNFVQLQSQSGRTESLTGLADGATTDVKAASEDDLLPRQVRFTLPDQLHAKLRPNGPSVMLRIEPAHLGPARLSLMMRKDQLSARLVVDSLAAKQVVEHSMDKLIDQLQRADIKVESVQVMTSQQQLGQDSSGRQSQWAHHQHQPHRFGQSTGGEPSDTSEPPGGAHGAAQFVGSGGVNLLA